MFLVLALAERGLRKQNSPRSPRWALETELYLVCFRIKVKSDPETLLYRIPQNVWLHNNYHLGFKDLRKKGSHPEIELNRGLKSGQMTLLQAGLKLRWTIFANIPETPLELELVPETPLDRACPPGLSRSNSVSGQKLESDLDREAILKAIWTERLFLKVIWTAQAAIGLDFD